MSGEDVKGVKRLAVSNRRILKGIGRFLSRDRLKALSILFSNCVTRYTGLIPAIYSMYGI
jgi:hypothetical protein